MRTSLVFSAVQKFDYKTFASDADWEFGTELARAWGEDQYKNFRNNMKNWFNNCTDDERSAGPMCNEVGATEMNGIENYVCCSAYTAVFQQRHPRFLAIGPGGFAFERQELSSFLKNIDHISRDLHMILVGRLSINKIWIFFGFRSDRGNPHKLATNVEMVAKSHQKSKINFKF